MTVSMNDFMDKHLTAQQRRQAMARGDELIADYMTLRDIRKAQALTQMRLAETLGITQKNVSQLEHRSDAMISTLRSYIEAMGGSLKLMVEFPDRNPLLLDGFATTDQDTPSAQSKASDHPG